MRNYALYIIACIKVAYIEIKKRIIKGKEMIPFRYEFKSMNTRFNTYKLIWKWSFFKERKQYERNLPTLNKYSDRIFTLAPLTNRWILRYAK